MNKKNRLGFILDKCSLDDCLADSCTRYLWAAFAYFNQGRD